MTNYLKVLMSILFRSLGFDEYDVDAAYLLMLEVVGAIIQLNFNDKIGNIKRRVLWKTLNKISSDKIEQSHGGDAGELSEVNTPALNMVLAAFPDKTKRSDSIECGYLCTWRSLYQI
jgi:hypothetical protein